jgi:hypothetical protein
MKLKDLLDEISQVKVHFDRTIFGLYFGPAVFDKKKLQFVQNTFHFLPTILTKYSTPNK